MWISIALNVILIVAIIVMAIKWPKTITIEDNLPEKNTPKNRWMKFQNEGASYIKEKDDKLYIKIVK